MKPSSLILVTNDDGIASPGLQQLAAGLISLGEVAVVAPDRERSCVAHALTLHTPLRAEHREDGQYVVEGTPTDCINLGVHGLLRRKPDLIVAGINRGANLGDDVLYSGTVAAAMEGAMMGVPSLAVSLACQEFAAEALARAVSVALLLARQVLHRGLPRDTFLNVNVPSGPHLGFRISRQGRRKYPDSIVEKLDPRGRTYYWFGREGLEFEPVTGTDSEALQQGYVAVTPLHLDLTNYRSFATLRRWGDGRLFEEKT